MLPPCSRLLVVGDVHLGARTLPPDAPRFDRLLAAVPDLADALVVNGDLFDFLFARRSGVPHRAHRVLDQLGTLAARLPVHLVGGNHDRWGVPGWTAAWGLGWTPRQVEVRVGARRVVCHHGDGLAFDGPLNRAVHAVVGSSLLQRAYALLPAEIGDPLVRRFGPTFDGPSVPSAVRERAARRQDAAAAAWLAAHPEVDLLVLGHTHRASAGQTDGGARWCNPGAFALDGSWLLVTADGETSGRLA